MLLGFIAGILNKYIGAYFEDIDVSQLTGSIFGGGITLNNINMRPRILESHGVPFHVVGGKCGKLEVKYSLTRLYSEPVVVSLEDLHVLVIPSQGVEYNAEAEEESKHNDKIRHLEIFESVKHHVINTHQRRATQIRSRKNNTSQAGSESLVGDMANSALNVPQEATYFDMWVMQVLRNIEFYVERVHVRFEDSVTKPMEPFAVGLFLGSLKVHTTDFNWKSQYIKDYVPETSYKLVKINGLSVYWNPSPTALYKEIIDREELFDHLALAPTMNDKAFKMLFEPISADLKVQVTPFPDVIQEPFSKPRLLIETSLHEIKLSASDKQFKDIIPFLDTLDALIKGLKYRKYRGSLQYVPYQGHYTEWWQFAYTCILDDIQRRRNNFRWERIREYRHKCKAYLKVLMFKAPTFLKIKVKNGEAGKAYYKKKTGNHTPPLLDLTLSQLERDLDLFMILILRQQVDQIIARQNQGQPSEQVEGYMPWILSWFSVPYWFPPVEVEDNTTGSVQGEASERPPHEIKSISSNAPMFSVTELTSNDKEIIRFAGGFAKNVDIISYPDDYVALESCVLLNQLRVRIYRLRGTAGETVLEGVLDKVSFVLRSRPVDHGLELVIKMGRVEVYGGDFPRDGSQYDLDGAPPLITTANPNAMEYFLKFSYEKNPLGSEVDHKVSLEGLALQFTFLHDSIERIVDCFTVPTRQSYPKQAKMSASKVLRKVMQFRNSPTTKLLRMMENKGKIELNICLIAPYLVIPQDSTLRGKTNFVVVNLGEINLVGTLVGGTLCENGKCLSLL